MTELIELRPLKTVKSRRSHKASRHYETAQFIPELVVDEESSYDERPIVLSLKPKSKKSSKRKDVIQTMPFIINTQAPTREKKNDQENQIQQIIINAQSQPPPSVPKKKEFVLNPIVGSAFPPVTEYIPMSTPTRSFRPIVERYPYEYRHGYTPKLMEEHPCHRYSSYEPPVRRIVRNYASNTRSVHLPPHARHLVNRFIDRLEDDHDYRYFDGMDYDHRIDDCRVCRRLRSAVDSGRRRVRSEDDLYRGSRSLCDAHRYHAHDHDHSKDCRVCHSLEKSNVIISTTQDQPKTRKKKREKQVHIVESLPSNIKTVEKTTKTTTAANTQPAVITNNASTTVSTLPGQSSYYPTSYTSYVDPYTGMSYAYDPYGTGMGYDYSSYYTNPAYSHNFPQYQVYNSTAPLVTDTLNPPAQPQQTETTTMVDTNPLVDTGTYTYMPTKHKKARSGNNTTVVVHNNRHPTPPTPKIIIEKSHSIRVPRKIRSTTVLKERSTQTPHVTTKTYVRT